MKISALALACLVGFSFATDPRFEQGARFEAQGNYEMALGEYRAVLAEQPQNSDAYFAAAEVRMKMKDYSGALANYRLAYKFDPKMSAAYEGAAKVYEALGQKAKAEAERAKDPKNAPVAAETPAPEAQAAAAPAETAAPAAEAAKAEEPKAEPAKTETAKAEEHKAEAPKTETAKAEEPKAEPVKTEVAKAEAPKAEPAKAEALPTDPFEKGKALYAAGKYQDAAPLWREVLRKTPGDAGAYFYAGLTRYQMGEYEKAEFNLKKGLDYKEEGNDANYILACIYQKTGKADLELKFLVNYIKKSTPDGKYRKTAEERMAAIKAAKAEAEKPAEAAKTETAKAEPAKQEPAKAEVAAAPAATAPAAASEPSEEATEEAAPSPERTLANANLLFSAGSYELALQMYKSLLEMEQAPEERYFTMLQLGNVYRELRDFNSAVSRYREVVMQYPDSDWASEAERALEDAVWLQKHAKELPTATR